MKNLHFNFLKLEHNVPDLIIVTFCMKDKNVYLCAENKLNEN